MLILAALTMMVGCAHQADQNAAQQQQLQALQARLDESERNNGRLTVRIEELEDDVFLLQDRVDANRIALQRRGIMGPHAQASAQKPSPTPQTYWGNTPQDNPYMQQERPVTRIPLGGGDDREWRVEGETYRQPVAERIPTNTVPRQQSGESELVITEKEFNAFTGDARRSPSRGATTPSGKKQAQAPVTDEKLPTTDELSNPEASKVAEPPSQRDALGTYKDALAEYRGGNYREALGGFEAFLASRPQPDYLDNALYWIGECHFGLGQYDDAVSYFQRVMKEQPDGNKVPDAMLKMSLAFDRVGRGAEATKLLEELSRQYPATNAGRLASQKLEDRK